MGNTQSAPERRDGNRLSKSPRAKLPRSGSYNQPVVSTSRIQSPYPDPQFGDDEAFPPTHLQISFSQRDLSQKNQTALSLVTTPKLAHDEDVGPALRSTTSPPEPFYKLKTPVSPPMNSQPSQMSLTIDPKSIDLNTAVALLEELRKTASPEDLVALRMDISLLRLDQFTDRETDKALLPVRPEPSSADPNHSAAALIRPKSLAPPGVATRKTSHSAKLDEAASAGTGWKPDMLGSSPLSKLEDLVGQVPSKSNKAKLQEPPSPKRAQTPGDMDYSHTGTFRIGSLVVTNGVPASPGPSLADSVRNTIRLSFDGGPDEGHLLTEESSAALGAIIDSQLLVDLGINPQTKEIFDADTTDEIPDVLPLIQNRLSRSFELRSSSPLRREVQREESVYDDEESALIAGPDSPVTKRLSTVAQMQTVTLADLVEVVQQEVSSKLSDEVPHPGLYHLRNESTHSASSLASEYQKDLPTSPFSPPDHHVDHITSPESGVAQLQHDSELDTSRDEGVEIPSKPGTPMSQLLFPVTPMENYLIPAPSNYFDPGITQKTALGSHPPDLSLVPAKSSSLKSRPSQSKSDSGYSSASAKAPEVDHNTSTLSSPWRHELEAPTEDARELDTAQEQQEPLELEGKHESIMQRSISLAEPAQSSPMPLLVHSQTLPVPKSNSEKPELRRSWRNSFMRLPLSRLRSSESVETHSTQSGSSDKADGAQKPSKAPKKKLQKKKRPESMKVFSLDGSFNNEIPRIPSGMLQRFDSRHSPSHNEEPSHLKVVKEEGSEARREHGPRINEHSVQVKSPMQYDDNLSRPPAVTSSSAPSVPFQRQQRRLSLKRFSRNADKEVVQSQRAASSDEEDDHHVYPQREYATFGSVSQSLGLSPYDAARKTNRYYANDSSASSNDAHENGRRAHRASLQGFSSSSQAAWNGEQPKVRPMSEGFRGRRRPKSFHGRGAQRRRMEVVGEEEIEVSSGDAQQMANAQGSRLRFAEVEASPLPQFGRPPLPISASVATTDWTFHEQTWKARRDGVVAAAAAAASAKGARPAKRESKHWIPEVLLAGAKVNSKRGDRGSVMRRNSFSQPDLRVRAQIYNEPGVKGW
jgi:hypothetical protein